uniref:CHAT domain-containing protein n=1 Tax=Calothrix rhizosoleniae TaxID=888997 RepID=UPI001177D6C6
MGKLVVINLVGGDFERGFVISLQIWTEGDRKWIAEAKGKLPPAKELLEHYKYWQLKYRHHVSGNYSARMSVTGGTDTTIISDIKKASKQLKSSLNDWLKADYDFSPIREKLFQTLKDEAEEIRVIFDTNNPELERLPWHLWDDFFKRYHRAEVALSLPVNKNPIVSSINHQVKVLAVFGRDTRINLQKDWEMLKKRLGEDSNAALINIDKPSLESLCEQIEEHKPQILFFAGHSRSEESGENGFIDLNDEESITIDNLEPELRKAVKWGLQLAIFNSCDGLGIARQLALLKVPNIIVMREPVPDELAQKFLQRFLEVFAWGKPLHLAVRRARERINRLENKFPGATWLPMTFQNPSEPPLTWRALGGIEIKQPSNHNSVENLGTETENASHIPWLQTFFSPTIKPTPLSQVKGKTITCKNGHENLSTNNFCIHCGVPLNNVLICSNGHENNVNNKFCSVCGEQLQRTSTVIISTDESTSIQATAIPAPTQAPTPPEVTHLSGITGGNFQTIPENSSANIGNILSGRYKITQILGQGGFGNTFIAQDMNLPGNPLCVVKQLKPVQADPHIMQVARRLFDTEAEIQYRLGRHEQIPSIFAHFEEKQEFYLVQEYIEGHDLK